MAVACDGCKTVPTNENQQWTVVHVPVQGPGSSFQAQMTGQRWHHEELIFCSLICAGDSLFLMSTEQRLQSKEVRHE